MDKHLTTLETSLVLTLGVLTLFGTSGATLVGDTSLTVNRGEDAVFNWMFEADTDPNAEPYQYVWFKRDKNNIHFLTVQLPDRLVTDVDSPYKDRTQTTGQLGLRLLNVGKKDAGTYLLYVYIHRATPENTEITLHVKYPPTNTTVTTPTRGWSTVESLAIKQGETLRLTCSTDSNPTSNFTWTRLENKLSPLAEVNTTSGGLTIHNVQRNDTGTYQCRAYNCLRPDGSWNVNVTIQYPAMTTTAHIVHPSRGNITEGDEVRIRCRVSDALPSPKFYWERNDDSIARGLPASAIADEKTGILTIPNIQPRDAGIYRCITDNGVAPVGSVLIMLNVTAELHQSNATKRAFKTTPRWVIPSYTSVAFAVYLSCITILWIWKAKVRKKDHNNDQDVNIFVVTEDYLPEYRSPSRAALLISGATSEEKMADPVVREFWDRLMTMDADRVLVFLQEKQILQADDAAGIRQAFSVVETLLETVSVLEKENSARVLSEALRHSEQQDLADLLEGKVLPDAKCLTVTNITDSTFSIEFQPAYTNVQHFGDVDSYVVTLAVAADEPQIIDTRDLLPSEPLHADFTDLNQGTSYNVTVVSKRGEVTSAGTTLTVTTIGGYEVPSPLLASLNPDERSQIHDVLISKDRITLQESLGKGYFGEVRRATCLRDNKLEFCAAKTLYDTSSHTEMESLLREGLRMIKFNHENVLRLTGICVHGNEAMIVLPYMKNGDLRKYLTNKQTLPLPENLRLCQEIAHGMAYLTDQGIVHRDLAARNCMLDDQSHLKVADFGLCRDVSEKGYYRIQHRDVALPAKWMAPESYEEQIFDTKTDVWSYGVVLWEIFSGGKTPYPGVHRFVIEYILDGNRMERPNMCPITL
ncbi:MET [Branchiostoma lanceolatum]|uniref:receptor protein-tyrosine kinase n=1 Tax=Branchiostoma lanceolatum TaxID=7740 RepID=A0A8J9YNM4_BRALA|nr:MET [Branchiostoma lanceolatum]